MSKENLTALTWQGESLRKSSNARAVTSVGIDCSGKPDENGERDFDYLGKQHYMALVAQQKNQTN